MFNNGHKIGDGTQRAVSKRRLVKIISGEPVQDPVITKDGIIFERRLIEKYLATNGTCPITKKPLTKEDLITVQLNPARPSAGGSSVSNAVPPVPRQTPTGTSIPSLLAAFQNEWDALMLSTYSLKQQLETTRQELSHALYQYDAALRVIARLTRERDEATEQLKKLQAASTREKMEVDGTAPTYPGITAEFKARLNKKSSELASQRKSRKISETLARSEQLRTLKSTVSLTPHRASTPGITCVALSPESMQQDTITHVLTGGMDCTVLLLDMQTQRKEATLSGHHKKITQVMFHPQYRSGSGDRNAILSSSQDGTVRVWRGAADTWKCVHVLNVHQGRSVPAFDIHVFGEHVLSVGEDATWAFTDMNTAQTLLSVPNVFSSDGSTRSPFTSCQIHPDGVILGTGTVDHQIRIWDLRSQKNVATFEGHTGEIVDLAFNENGYFLATVARDEVLKLWDLRAPKIINSITLGTPPQTLEYDYSGRYLAVAMGNELRIFADKTLDHVYTIDEHTAEVTDVKWGRDAKSLVTTSMDRQIKVFTVTTVS